MNSMNISRIRSMPRNKEIVVVDKSARKAALESSMSPIRCMMIGPSHQKAKPSGAK
jgi:hypothetical protein